MVQDTLTKAAEAPDEGILESAPALSLRSGSTGQFARLRSLLESIGYTGPGICTRAGTDSITHFQSRPDRAVNDALDLCIKLFLDGEPVARVLLHQHLPENAPALFRELGLLEDLPRNPDLCRAPLSLYPQHGLYIVSDQIRAVVGEGTQQAADVVYPALSSTSTEFVEGLPVAPCVSYLDIGAGTGVAALLAASTCARHAWALDITERATRVCEFNAQFNGIENITALAGDLYDPVMGLTFDCIVSHPPYMPEPVSRIIFRDGGADGEQITRRIIAGLPRYLNPGGRFYCRCMATDRKDAPLEQRVRAMLGPAHEEFDVLVISNSDMQAAAFYSRLFAIGSMSVAQLDQQLRTFARLDVENVVIGFVYIRRHATARSPLTLRRRLAQKHMAPNPHSYDWLLGWERASSQPDLASQLMDAHPCVAAEAQIRLTHRMHEGQLRAEVCSVTTGIPFAFDLEASPGTILLLGACNGTRSVTALYEEMKEVGAVPSHATLEQFLHLIRVLIGGGVLEVESYRLPKVEART